MLAQFSDNFSDGDFTNAPSWSGNTTEFLVNAGQQLQLNNTVAATSVLTNPFVTNALGITEWNFLIKFTFAPSSTNFGRVYLISDQANLAGPLNGYFLQFGEPNTNDAIELFRQTGSTITSICRGTNASIANAFNVRVKVTRDALGAWVISTDYSGGTNYVQETTGTDNTIVSSSFFGVRCTYTATNATKFFFDDFNLTMQTAPDLTPPTWNSVDVISSNTINLKFSETLDQSSAQTTSNYILGTNLNPDLATLLADQKTVQLSFASPFTNGVNQSLQVQNVKDVALNIMIPATKNFLYFQPVASALKDIVINELLPDPTPVIGLPEAEFVELYNRSSNPFDLTGWTVTDGTTVGTLSSLILLPGEYLILSSSSSTALFQSFGNRMGLSAWPSLNNSGDLIKLKNPQGKTIDSVSYALSWYQNDEKKDGGYSLELIDPENFCKTAGNWRASDDPIGGTPGKVNSIFAVTPDLASPRLVSVASVSASEIQLSYDERLAKSSLNLSAFEITPTTNISIGIFADGECSKINLQFSSPLDSSATYSIKNTSIHDCPGNLIQPEYATLNFKLDQSKPVVNSIQVVNDGELVVAFSERIDVAQATNVSNYIVGNYSGSISPLVLPGEKSVRLYLNPSFRNGFEYSITISGIRDRAGNLMESKSQPVMFFEKKVSHRRDVIITEIMADPTPPVGLPEAEYIEIYNRSHDPFNLKTWTISDATSTATLPDVILLPDSFLILSLTTKAAGFSTFGKSIGVAGFPSLNNTGEPLVLRDENDQTIDSVNYSDKWYGFAEKKDGGYSLELKDYNDVCRDASNWSASNDSKGGTPGKKNSVYEIYTDDVGPRLLSLTSIDSTTIQLVFDEKLSLTSAKTSNLNFSPGFTIDSCYFGDSSYTTIKAKLSAPLDSATTYFLQVSSILDCPGNLITPESSKSSLKLDLTKPFVNKVDVLDDKQVLISFSERLDKLSAETVINYEIGDSTKISAAVLQENGLSVTLQLNKPLVNGKRTSVRVTNVTDRAHNAIDEIEKSFLFFQKQIANRKDIIITEILADPTPVAGLPEAEFIEVLNRSDKPFNLKGWTLSDATSKAVLPETILLPNHYLILTTTAKASLFGGFGSSIGVIGFPSLNNTGEQLVLRDETNRTIDSLNYSDKWYQSSEKKDGGFSLEIKDTENFCRGGENWSASKDSLGGTPGKVNSVFEIITDLTGPKFQSVVPADMSHLLLGYDERLSSASLDRNAINISPSIGIDSINFRDSDAKIISIKLQNPFDSAAVYTIKTPLVFDCPGNKIEAEFASVIFKADTVKPHVVDVMLIDSRTLMITFSEKVANESGLARQSYLLNNTMHPDAVVAQPSERSVKLLFADQFENGKTDSLRISNVRDVAGNVIEPVRKSFLFFHALPVNRKDVIFSEILADPTPPVGLPENEFVEIFNRSDNPINLSNWKLADGNSSTTLPDYIILPGQHVVLCPSTKVSLFRSFGNAIGVPGFPSLSNAGESLILRNSMNETIDSVAYDVTFYNDDEKEDGGWSMELIDPENICAESSNWAASENEKGGTPGTQNSVAASKPDLIGPVVVSVFANGPTTITVTFNEKLERQLPDIKSVDIDPLLPIARVSFEDLSLRTLVLTTATPIESRQLYSISFSKIYDCAGNEIQPDHARDNFALTEEADSLDVLVNELLFNPSPTGVDFLEVYNNSEKYINLRNWKVGNKETSLITDKNFLLKPEEYLVLTKDAAVLKSEYIRTHEEKILQTDLPSFNDDTGQAALLNPAGKVIDQFNYDDSFHSPFLTDHEGVSLERISFNFEGDVAANWKSANESVGFATPGYVNSNAFSPALSNDAVAVAPEIFDPHSGQPNFTEISYKFDHGGYVASVRVIDNMGRQIKTIADNSLIGTNGIFRWDGDAENGVPASTGAYMISFEIFDESGQVLKFRKRVAIAATR